MKADLRKQKISDVFWVRDFTNGIIGPSVGMRPRAVIAKTRKGKAVICSDAVPTYHNCYPYNAKYGSPQQHLERIPPGIHVNVNDCLKSIDRIAKIIDLVIPTHEPRVQEFKAISL